MGVVRRKDSGVKTTRKSGKVQERRTAVSKWNAPASFRLEEYAKNLRGLNRSDKTIESYLHHVRHFLMRYGTPTQEKILQLKEEYCDLWKPSTLNGHLIAIGNYCEFMEIPVKIKLVKEVKKNYCDDVLSFADYKHLLKCLKKDGRMEDYFRVRFLAATGARISEALRFKIADVRIGYVELYGKGKKWRRIYFPKKLQQEALKYYKEDRRYVFSAYAGKRSEGSEETIMSSRGVANFLRYVAKKYGIEPRLMHPHSFRHFFAKAFLAATNDLVLLADLLGHESIDTTRIYLRKTASEQREVVDKTVTW